MVLCDWQAVKIQEGVALHAVVADGTSVFWETGDFGSFSIFKCGVGRNKAVHYVCWFLPAWVIHLHSLTCTFPNVKKKKKKSDVLWTVNRILPCGLTNFLFHRGITVTADKELFKSSRAKLSSSVFDLGC